jgi:enoyl-CoA hydratase
VAGKKVRYECDSDDVGQIILDAQPLHLFDLDLTNDLIAALEEAEGDMLRALVVRAEGKVFTGGVDVHVFDDKTPAQANNFFQDLLRITHKLEDMPWPTIACVQGLCLTAGFEMALGCDLIWAGESARFGLVEIVVGLTPAMGGTQRVAERAGPARARELVMSGDLYPAEVLERWNVVNRVLPDDELQESAMKVARRLAAGPTKANAATKAMVRAFLEHGVRGADARIGDIAAPLFATDDLQNAVDSFLEHGPGKATFKNR